MSASVPYFERALQLDPGYELVRNHLLVAIQEVPNPELHVDWLRQEASRARQDKEGAQRLRIIANAFLAAGSEPDAVATFRKANALDGGPWPPGGYAFYLMNHGRAREAELELRQALATLDPAQGSDQVRRQGLQVTLFHSLLTQGRLAEARAVMAGSVVKPRGQARWLAYAAGVGGSVDELRRAVAHAESFGLGEDVRFRWDHALDYLDAGLPSEAARLLAKIPDDPGPEGLTPGLGGLTTVERFLLEMARAWASGDLPRAEEAARKAVDSSPPALWRLLVYQSLGLVQVARGDCSGAISSLEKAREQRMSPRYVVEISRVLTPLAECYERTGEVQTARARVEELLALWREADPDLPRLVQAKALQARLAAATPPPR